MRLLKGSDGSYGLSFPYNPEIVGKCKSIPGMRWDGANKVWVGSPDAVQCVFPKLTQASPPDHLCDLETLRPYQRQGAAFLSESRAAILADEMGLGKTLTALTAADSVGARTIIVCPNYVRGVWEKEIEKWGFPGKVILPRGVRNKSDDCLPDSGWVIINYDILYAWDLSAWNPECVIFDEAHMLSNAESRRTKACKELAGKCKYRWALTGTPLTNRVRDLYAIVDTISPGRFGSFFAYGVRYCAAYQEQVTPVKRVWKFDGKSNLDELSKRLAWFTLRRTKTDVGLQLPPKTRQVIWLDVPGRKPSKVVGEPSKALLRSMLDKSADAKMGEAFSLVLSHLAAGSKVTVFCYRRAVAEAIVDYVRQEGYEGAVIHGGIPVARRSKSIDWLKEKEGGGLLACTIDSSATGIDLSFCDVGVFAELVYSPHELLQAEARICRFGQSKPALIQYVLAKGTIEELMSRVVIDRLDLYGEVVGKLDDRPDLAMSEEDIMGELYAGLLPK